MPKGGSPKVTMESVEEMIGLGQREQESLLVSVRHHSALPQSNNLDHRPLWPLSLGLGPSHYYKKRQMCKRTSCGPPG